MQGTEKKKEAIMNKSIDIHLVGILASTKEGCNLGVVFFFMPNDRIIL
jgi:hypothetical protein